MTVFADTFFYLALFNTRDAHHLRVLDFIGNFFGGVVTTQWVLTEVADAFARILSAACCSPTSLFSTETRVLTSCQHLTGSLRAASGYTTHVPTSPGRSRIASRLSSWLMSI